MKKHIKEILIGHFSQTGEPDTAYIEPLIIQNDVLNTISDLGLSDIRVILGKGKIISAMIRIPTKKVMEKQIYIKAQLALPSTFTQERPLTAMHKGKEISHHPDSNVLLTGIDLPFGMK